MHDHGYAVQSAARCLRMSVCRWTHRGGLHGLSGPPLWRLTYTYTYTYTYPLHNHNHMHMQLIQLRCEVCGGRGLVPSAGAGKDKYLRKW